MGYLWKPIAELSSEERQIDLSDVDSLKEAWLEVRKRLSESSPKNLKEFHERLERQWSIETGILERIYDLDRGTTKILIERGFVAGYIERSSTNQEPQKLINILRDHQAATDIVHDCIANSRALTIGLIHELHSILTRHQETVEAVDQFGGEISVPLARGTFKATPNNPTRLDNQVHEYCPPIHVGSEMDNLITWYNRDHEANPILLAAWLHHRFTQIHPYQDGNGRIARTLANLVLIKGALFPVVITRDHRTQYIEALETADFGNIKPLTRLFAEIEKKTILEALSISPDAPASTKVVEGVIDALASRLNRRREEKRQSLRGVNQIAESLQGWLRAYLETMAGKVIGKLRGTGGLDIGRQLLIGGPKLTDPYGKPTEHWYRHEVTQTAHQGNQWANFDENHYFIRLRFSPEQLPWLDFVVSFHHVGQELSGVMEATAFALVTYPGAEVTESKAELIRCMDKPFTFTHRDNAESLRSKFLDWVEAPFAIAVKSWGDQL